MSSDACGIVVRYNMTDQTLIDRVQHPSTDGNQKVILSQEIGELGVSVVVGDSSFYLYKD